VKLTTKLWIALGAFILLSPLGLILPDHFKAGSAWGEWDRMRFRRWSATFPRDCQESANSGKAPMPDYAFKGWRRKG